MLNKMAFTLIGDSSAWPIVVTLAERKVASNSFVISVAAQKELKQFGIEHKRVLHARAQISDQIKNGARVFASELLDSVTSECFEYDKAIVAGSAGKAALLADEIVYGVGRIGQLIETNRNEPIDARLAEKTGIVDKRIGYLGNWETATKGDLFVADDGVRTGEISMALLNFVDGVDVAVDPNTTVVIRESQRDRLNQTVKRNIALLNGSLLTKLSEKAKETNDLSFEAGSSESSVKSGKFWASATGDLSARVSNYDGTIDLSASNVRVTLTSNEGTVVKKGQPPLQPIALLPQPQLDWPQTDSIIYSDKFLLKWKGIAGGVKYQIEASPGKDFYHDIKSFLTASTKFELIGIPVAVTYVRIHGIDKYGLRGIDSPVYTLIRTRNVLPPPIQIEGWETDRRYTVLSELTVRGKSRPGVKLTVNGKRLALDQSGGFSYVARVQKPETELKIVASDESGKSSSRTLSIVTMDTAKVFNIEWNCQANGDSLNPSGATIEAKGAAYPQVKVLAELDNQRTEVSTSPQGIWAISLKPVKGSVLKITFESIEDARPIGTKTWKVQ